MWSTANARIVICCSPAALFSFVWKFHFVSVFFCAIWSRADAIRSADANGKDKIPRHIFIARQTTVRSTGQSRAANKNKMKIGKYFAAAATAAAVGCESFRH